MNLDEPEFQRQDASTQVAMKRALDVLSKVAAKEQAGADEVVPPLPDELRDQWLRELARSQAEATPARRVQSQSIWQQISAWWHAPKFWMGGLAAAALVVMCAMIFLPPKDEERITRGGDVAQTDLSLRLVVIATNAVFDEFSSLRSGEVPVRYDSAEQALAELGSTPMLIVDFSTKKILVMREGRVERVKEFPSDDLLDVSMAVDELLAP